MDIKFNYNKEKAKEVILYLVSKTKNITKLELLKFLYFADKYHLNKYNRPIVGGHYVAMPRGTVLSEVLDYINNGCEDFKTNGINIIANRTADTRYFSKSDIEALDYAICQYSQYTADELSELTHKEKSWLNAREKNPTSNNAQILYEDMLEDTSDETLEYLREYSYRMVV